ncbi:hypothetical protein HCN44_009754 [Aphidius gifuensis]|uniref:Biogenesis of lysosome-related organelles complex 1 subunit 4 n=1 Tax=Aphidius gifuensis TaxID=684658 RepID=A0A834Y8C6_APHGI|nr:biogenesis of lysosome-related organelles complex 1 subunit 4 [Aphidius gifuensis]KAF7998356.1 hypothetical protein HCN44_009754 [Aphidius gifuensis]
MPESSNNNKNEYNKMIEDTARDYASYIKLDLPNQTQDIHETIEEMLARLEEFESIVGMVQNLRAECAYEHLVKLRSAESELMTIFKRIDALENIVAKASVDLSNLEAAVDTAENELGGYSTVSDRLFGILKPLSLFKSKSQDNSTSTASTSTASSSSQLPRRDPFKSPMIYRTEDAFDITDDF